MLATYCLPGPSSNDVMNVIGQCDIPWKVQMVQISSDYIMIKGGQVLFSVLYECKLLPIPHPQHPVQQTLMAPVGTCRLGPASPLAHRPI